LGRPDEGGEEEKRDPLVRKKKDKFAAITFSIYADDHHRYKSTKGTSNDKNTK
jgi:hypothetical protein